jgi:hypothetical protein
MAGSMKAVSTVILASALIPVVSAKPVPQKPDVNVQTAAQRLVGENTRTWIFKRIEVVMGGSGRCTSGETLSFSADHKVEIKICENQHLVTKSLNWSLSQEGSLDLVVMIGATPYSLTFWRKGSATFMRLRTLTDTRITPRVSKVFLLEKAE